MSDPLAASALPESEQELLKQFIEDHRALAAEDLESFVMRLLGAFALQKPTADDIRWAQAALQGRALVSAEGGWQERCAKAEADLRAVDMLLDRRDALSGFVSRIDKIACALKLAALFDPKGERANAMSAAMRPAPPCSRSVVPTASGPIVSAAVPASVAQEAIQKIATMAMIAQSDPYASAEVYRRGLIDICNFALRKIPAPAPAAETPKEPR